MRFLVLLSTIACADIVLAQPARRALLVVNSAYQKMPPLPANQQPVEALAQALSKADFQVTIVRDLTQAEDVLAVKSKFLDAIQPGDVCLYYFSGYAIAVDGANFLLPIDFDPVSKAGDINYLSRSLTGLQQYIDLKKAGLKLLLLETANQSAEIPAFATQPGLAEPESAESREILFAFAAKLAALPADIPEPDRYLFTRSAAQAILVPGASAEEAFSAARRTVALQSTEKSVPYYLSNVIEPFLFTPKPVEAKPPDPAPVDLFLKRTHVSARDRQEYAYIPPGKFLMGCAKNDATCEEREKPQHQVTVTQGFWMGVTEATIDAYSRWVDEDPKTRKKPGAPLWNPKWKDTSLPMVQVTWEQANTFCQWAGGRLPTEAEWEYVARAGKENERFPLNSENSREKANFYGKKGNDKYEVGAPPKKFDPDKLYGIFDMAGNVWEWTADYFGETYFQTSPEKDPTGPGAGKDRVIRGGSYDSAAEKHLRLSFRKGYGKPWDNIGFRCLLPDSQQTRRLLP